MPLCINTIKGKHIKTALADTRMDEVFKYHNSPVFNKYHERNTWDIKLSYLLSKTERDRRYDRIMWSEDHI